MLMQYTGHPRSLYPAHVARAVVSMSSKCLNLSPVIVDHMTPKNHELVMSCEEFDSMTTSEMGFSPHFSLYRLRAYITFHLFPIITIAYALPPTLDPLLFFHFEDLSIYKERLQGVVESPPLISRNSHDHHRLNRYSDR